MKQKLSKNKNRKRNTHQEKVTSRIKLIKCIYPLHMATY